MSLQLVITTHQRPEHFRRALTSVSVSVESLNNFSTVLIIDDSADEGQIRSNRDCVDAFRSSTQMDCRYLSTGEDGHRIHKTVNPEAASSLRFALGTSDSVSVTGFAGSARNTTLLLSSSDKVVSLDDDARLLFMSFSEAAWVSRECVPPVLPFGNLKRAYTLLRKEESGRIAMFEALLGAAPDQSQSTETGAELQGPVKAAMTGIFGGRWYSRPYAHLMVPPVYHRQIWKNKTEYTDARSKPFALLLSPELLFSSSPFFVTTCFGFDASTILPPFFPGIRGSDLIWGKLLRICYAGSPIAHLPLAVEHDYESKERLYFDDIEAVHPISAELVLAFLDYFQRDYLGDEAGVILPALGSRFIMLSESSDEDFQEFCRSLYLQNSSDLTFALQESLISGAGASRYWKRDVKEFLALKRSCIMEPEACLPLEFIRRFGEEGSLPAFKEYIGRCGRLMSDWPAIWSSYRPMDIPERIHHE